MKSHTRDHILQCAARLFFVEGLATGIDRVTSECQTAKMTIYTNFASKDGLICAILHNVQTTLFGNLRSHAQHTQLPPRERLEAAFNILCYGMNDPAVMAGLLVRAVMEFPQAQHPVHRVALDLEKAILNYLEPLCAAVDPAESEAAARQLLLLAKGCFVMSATVGLVRSRMLATALADHLLRAGAPTNLAPEEAALG